MAATDADVPADTLTYSIVGGADAALFSIDGSTGVLTFITAPDFENPVDVGTDNVYEVQVQVSDGNGGTDTQLVSVTVTDVPNTLLVTTTSDDADGNTTSIEALNADKGTDGEISLREAIEAANNTSNGGTPDLIAFDIAGPGPHTIKPLSALPMIAQMIDGYMPASDDLYASLSESRTKPHVMDDATVDRVIAVHGGFGCAGKMYAL